MGIIRLVVILVIGWLIYSLTRRWLASLQNKSGQRQEHIDTMIRCDQCGLHIPHNEAIQSAGKNYCSVEHKQLSEKSQN